MIYRLFYRLKGEIKDIFMPWVNGIISLFVKDPLYLNAWIEVKNGKVLHNNWGDDVNLNIVSLLSNKKVIIRPSVKPIFEKEKVNYTCIGSVIGLYENSHSIVWGSGAISKDTLVKINPLKICSVRGPLTRGVLLSQGIDCPEKYGDPALLLSRYIRPSFKKLYKVGIIPHYKDLDNPFVIEFCNNNNVLLIKMQGYDDWKDVLNQICQCERIISSSLHGLIISDSYRVPNAWVRFSDKIKGGDFKYLDYFESVGRIEKDSKVIKCIEDLEQIVFNNEFSIARYDKIDFRSIFDTCPFKDIKKDYIHLVPHLPEYHTFAEKEVHFSSNIFINREDELDAFIEKFHSFEKGLIFRGVSEAKYKMYASSQRHWLQKTDWVARISRESYYDFVEEIIRRSEALEDVQNYMCKLNVHTNDMFLMALMQHFDAPSPMIDFSESLLTGLFFASDFNDSKWEDSGKNGINDYVSLYYIPKGFDWVEATIQRVMMLAADKLQNMISEVHTEGIKLDTKEEEDNISRLLYRQFRLDGVNSNITFIPLGGPSLGRVSIDIPVINFHCEYEIVNDRIVKQQGLFIMNNTENEPLVEVMNKQSQKKMFGCVNIHKNLIPYLRIKYLVPNHRNRDMIYENEKKDVIALKEAFISLA